MSFQLALSIAMYTSLTLFTDTLVNVILSSNNTRKDFYNFIRKRL